MIGVGQPMPGVVYPRSDLLRSYVEAGELPLSTIPERMWESFARHAGRVALSTAEGDIGYAELDAITDRLGGALVRLGLRPLDRVLFQSANSKEVTYALIACFKAGLIPVCTLVAHREREIGYIGAHTEAAAIIVQDDDPKFDLVAFARSMRPSLPDLRHVISMRGESRQDCLRLEDLLAGESQATAREMLIPIRRDPFQVALFQLSGGTTGVPKVIPRMHGEYLLNGLRTVEVLGYRTDDVMFMPMQIIHNACMICFWVPTLLIGATFTIPADMKPASWADRFRHLPPTFVGLIRPLLPRFETLVDLIPSALDHIRAFWSPDSSRALRHRYARPSYAMFGMSEGMNMYVRPGDPDEVADWTVGRPISRFDEIRLVRPGTDEEAPVGEVGELTCRGPYTLSGYYRAPERNAEAFNKEGFYRSGDLLETRVIDGRVYYAFAGRTKDVVDRGSEKINCEEVEHAMLTHAAIAGCAVVGMPDPVLGERVCAFVIPREGHTLPDVPAIQRHMGQIGMAKFKWPERIEPIEAMPLTNAGKLDKAALRASIATKLSLEKPMHPTGVHDVAEALTLNGVHHSARPTWKLKETVEFYRDVLGLPLVHCVSARGWGSAAHPDFIHFFFDSGAGSTIAFFYYLGDDQPEHLQHRPEYDNDAIHTAWKVDSREALLAWRRRLESRGVRIMYQIEHEVVESIYFRDPNGYYIEIGRPLRPFIQIDRDDARLTLDAAVEAERRATERGQRVIKIEEVWRLKGAMLLEKLHEAA